MEQLEAPIGLKNLTLRHVLCMAGDGEPDTVEKRVIDTLSESEGDNLFAECLRLVVGRVSVPDFAEQEWNTLLSHRRELEQTLGRPVGLQTAALDFFCDARPGSVPDVVLVPFQTFQTMRQEARVDATTGLFTPSSFAWALEHEVRRARRYRRKMVLVLIDVDDIDVLKARRGTDYGDFVLREIATLVNKNIRNTDTAARLDNDKFAILLHECRLLDGRSLAERLRVAIEQQTFSLHEGDAGAHLTACLSVVGYPESGDAAEKLLDKAHRLLEIARSAGKNRVEADEVPE